MQNAPPTHDQVLADADEYFTQRYQEITGLIGAQHYLLHGDEKEEAIADTLALTWFEYVKLARAGGDVVKLLGKIVEFAAMRVRCGRTLTNFHTARDIMSDRCRFRNGYRVNGLPLSDRDPMAGELLDALRDDASPADQAILKLDFEAWLETLDDRRREIAELLASGLTTADVGRLRGVSRAAIHWVRKDLIESWREFHGEETAF